MEEVVIATGVKTADDTILMEEAMIIVDAGATILVAEGKAIITMMNTVVVAAMVTKVAAAIVEVNNNRIINSHNIANTIHIVSLRNLDRTSTNYTSICFAIQTV